jgi:hypothetical protein
MEKKGFISSVVLGDLQLLSFEDKSCYCSFSSELPGDAQAEQAASKK